ncbi:hypothetical protein CVT23_13300 [Minwuia thermotolerans]|uniref:Uncharacterized protein n=1 Tax=Minwuia thermotolerans TaxID=2056226 RepID=A0A2M9G0F2_9PROT|nr:hypothetical protein CVT23_13300 [Minwuia thermotolerans]
MSAPAPPSRLSSPSPPRIVSSPAAAEIRSLPPPPTSEFCSTLPVMMSLSKPPMTFSILA